MFTDQSAGILLAAEIVERVSGRTLRELEESEIFSPLGMTRSALGLGSFELEDTVRLSGVGSTAAVTSKEEEEFGGNSLYWRDMGHPWGYSIRLLFHHVATVDQVLTASLTSPIAMTAITGVCTRRLLI